MSKFLMIKNEETHVIVPTDCIITIVGSIDQLQIDVIYRTLTNMHRTTTITCLNATEYYNEINDIWKQLNGT